MNFRSLAVSSVLSAAVAAGTFGTIVPALAQPSPAAATCSGTVTCTYIDAGYSNFMGSRSPGSALENISSTYRNKLSSWVNYSGGDARFYYDLNGHGQCVRMPHQSMASASSTNPDNDQAESWAFNGSC